MYIIIGGHFVPLDGKFLLIALVLVRITLNVMVHQMLLAMLFPLVAKTLPKCLRV
jgi:hypothetical protein